MKLLTAVLAAAVGLALPAANKETSYWLVEATKTIHKVYECKEFTPAQKREAKGSKDLRNLMTRGKPCPQCMPDEAAKAGKK